MFERPNSGPAPTAVRAIDIQTSGRSRKLMKPGPATATSWRRESSRSRAANSPASHAGFCPSDLAATIAAFVESSPWPDDFGRSTVTAENGKAFSNPCSSKMTFRRSITIVLNSKNLSIRNRAPRSCHTESTELLCEPSFIHCWTRVNAGKTASGQRSHATGPMSEYTPIA